MTAAAKNQERTDEALMIRAQADDTNDFAALYDRHSFRALCVAEAICRDHSRAEDVVQEGFLAIWRSRGSYRPATGSFQAWSMRIVQNRAIDSYRQKAARPRTETIGFESNPWPPDDDSPTPHDAALASSDHDELFESLRRLPEAQAEVIVLAFYGELTHLEIAAQLCLPTGTVKGRMRLGLERMRYEMDTSATGSRRSAQPSNSATAGPLPLPPRADQVGTN